VRNDDAALIDEIQLGPGLVAGINWMPGSLTISHSRDWNDGQCSPRSGDQQTLWHSSRRSVCCGGCLEGLTLPDEIESAEKKDEMVIMAHSRMIAFNCTLRSGRRAARPCRARLRDGLQIRHLRFSQRILSRSSHAVLWDRKDDDPSWWIEGFI
jgi:hypothetical protein